MATHESYRCSKCDINYPYRPPHRTCQVCGLETWHNATKESGPGGESSKADDNWKEKVEERLNWREHPDDWLVGPIPDVELEIHHVKDKLWVVHRELLEAGYYRLNTFSIVLIRGVYFELQGRAGVNDKDIPGGAWWIEPIDVEAEVNRWFSRIAVLEENPEHGG